MAAYTVIAVGAGLLLGVIHFISESLVPASHTRRNRVVSFAAGISIAYLFLILLPHTYEAADRLRESVFLFLLLGFSVFHLIEKLIHQHADREKLAEDLKEVHSIAFFLYHFMVGVVLKHELGAHLVDGLLFLLPVGLHAALSTASLSRIHGRVREKLWIRISLSSSTLLGILFTFMIPVPEVAEHIFISLIAGVLLYIIVREFLPFEAEGRPLFFILGIGAFAVLFVLICFH